MVRRWFEKRQGGREGREGREAREGREGREAREGRGRKGSKGRKGKEGKEGKEQSFFFSPADETSALLAVASPRLAVPKVFCAPHHRLQVVGERKRQVLFNNTLCWLQLRLLERRNVRLS